MTDISTIKALCLEKSGAEETLPFGPWPICYKVGGKIFAQVYPDKVTLKCTVFSGEALRQAYPGIVVRGYHCPPVQQPYWNTVLLQHFPEDQLPMLIDHAYDAVVQKLPKKVRDMLRTASEGPGDRHTSVLTGSR